MVVIYPDGSDEITLTSLLYSESEPWSACRRSCLTSRIRNCRIKNLCEVDTLVEEAYCYIPGTKCEEKVTKIIEKKTIESSPSASDYYENENKETEDYYITESVDENHDENLYFDIEDSFIFLDDVHYDIHSEDEEEAEGKDILFSPEEVPDEGTDGIEDGNYEDYYDQEPKDKDTEIVHFDAKPEEQTCGRSSSSSPFKMFRIVGGSEAIKGLWPWQVAVLNRFKELFCGGTMIAPSWILTAAHCVKRVLYVRIGEHDLGKPEGEVELKVEKSFKHPDFDLETIDSDIALLKIPEIKDKSQVTLSSACLPAPFDPLPREKSCFALGWGKERQTHIFGSDILKYVKVPIVNENICHLIYDDYEITENMFCAGALKGGADACEGDSGGPLLCEDEDKRWVLHGVTSFGEGCGRRNSLGVYVKVSNYVDWINKIMENN